LSLTFAEESQSFVLQTPHREVGEEHGMTLWTGDCAPGRYTFFTSRWENDRYVPDNNPFQALPFIGEADHDATARLVDLYMAYLSSLATDVARDFPCPPGLEYAPYQRAAIHYGLSREHVLLGDEPGLGKTVEALGLVNATGADRVLVVAPAAVRLQWEREIRKWCPQFGKIRTVLKTSDGFDARANATVISYDLARSASFLPLLQAERWDTLILDEAHYLKNHDAKRTRAVLGGYSADGEHPGIASSAARVVALTGTPLPNRPKECYTLARALDHQSISEMSWDAFCLRFNPTCVMPNGYELTQGKNLAELQARLRCNFMVRRLKKDVLKDLPDKRYELTLVEPNGEINRVLRAESLLNVDPDGPDFFLDADGKIDGAISTVRKDMGVAKLPRIIEHVRYVLDSGVDKIVLFLYHREVIVGALEGLRSFSPAVVYGGVTPKQREERKNAFVNDPRCRIFVGQLTAAGTGIDGLQHATDHVIFGEADWVPGVNDQCVDRLHRYGQRGSVLAQFLVAPGSLDERILGGAIKKLHTTNQALDQGLLR
jgi:SWI/SNF-related matrix-associated actin-dependent regulator 1 of chromatin subfamily A